eukprot:CAMPEP_0174973698 /NCGR_PEP_ID=MMETSP0004_2-20121128/11391_1 /TAXON_ID=420556 /ORGANISM="Ochromonas sp., Strain CCMP1393" /LENGTH=271 /DNA_ID=CAMNT_0016224185 /DNA_START=54 /DNA_END=870 /DNA_ORIENTATION=+
MRGAVEEERPSANSVQSRVLNEKDLDELAESNGWTKMKTKVSANQGMVAYKKGNNRLNFWLTTGTCSSSLQHPTQGKTQLFRRQINITEADEIFKNPRKHTGKGYKDNAEREYNLERNQYREQSMLGEKRSRRRGDSDDEEMDLEEEMRPAKPPKFLVGSVLLVMTKIVLMNIGVDMERFVDVLIVIMIIPGAMMDGGTVSLATMELLVVFLDASSYIQLTTLLTLSPILNANSEHCVPGLIAGMLMKYNLQLAELLPVLLLAAQRILWYL